MKSLLFLNLALLLMLPFPGRQQHDRPGVQQLDLLHSELQIYICCAIYNSEELHEHLGIDNEESAKIEKFKSELIDDLRKSSADALRQNFNKYCKKVRKILSEEQNDQIDLLVVESMLRILSSQDETRWKLLEAVVACTVRSADKKLVADLANRSKSHFSTLEGLERKRKLELMLKLVDELKFDRSDFFNAVGNIDGIAVNSPVRLNSLEHAFDLCAENIYQAIEEENQPFLDNLELVEEQKVKLTAFQNGEGDTESAFVLHRFIELDDSLSSPDLPENQREPLTIARDAAEKKVKEMCIAKAKGILLDHQIVSLKQIACRSYFRQESHDALDWPLYMLNEKGGDLSPPDQKGYSLLKSNGKNEIQNELDTKAKELAKELRMGLPMEIESFMLRLNSANEKPRVSDNALKSWSPQDAISEAGRP